MNDMSPGKVVAIHKPTKTEVYISEVLPQDRFADLCRSLPKHIPPARFQRNLMNAVMANPDLMQCHPAMVYREVSKAASLGLLLDPQLGEAYIVVRNQKAKDGSWQKVPGLQVGYRGLMKLGRQSGEISMMYAHEVCQHDEVECVLGLDKRLVHKPQVFGDRGPVIGYYAVVRYRDGESDFEPMSIGQVHEIRDRSDGWKAYKAGRIKSTPWSTDESEMAKKTVLRRLLKRVPQSSDLADTLADEDRAEDEPVDITPIAPPERQPALVEAPTDEGPKQRRARRTRIEPEQEADSQAEATAGLVDPDADPGVGADPGVRDDDPPIDLPGDPGPDAEAADPPTANEGFDWAQGI